MIVLRPLHDEIVTANQVAVPDEEHLYPSLVVSVGDRYGVQVFPAQSDDFLSLVNPLDCAQPVPKGRGAFEFELVGSIFHSRL